MRGIWCTCGRADARTRRLGLGQAARRLVGALCSAGWAGVSGWAALSAVALDHEAPRMLGGVGDLARPGEAMAGLRLVALAGGGREARRARVGDGGLEVEVLLLEHLEGLVALCLAHGVEDEVAVPASIRGVGAAEGIFASALMKTDPPVLGRSDPRADRDFVRVERAEGASDHGRGGRSRRA